MLAAFLPPYPFRATAAPYLWCYYRLLTDWAAESALFITGRDYVRPVSHWSERWECQPQLQSRLAYHLPDDPAPAQHHYAWLDESRYSHWLAAAQGNPVEAFRRFLCDRDADFEAELATVIDAAPSPVEAVVTICNVPSLEAVCAERGIAVIHVELGPLRGPLYRETGYVDFRGVNGHTECASRYACWPAPSAGLARNQWLRFFLNHQSTLTGLTTQPSVPCGVVLQVEDDSNLVAYGQGMSNLSLLSAARQRYRVDELRVRPHPGSAFAVRQQHVLIDDSPHSLAFVANCHAVWTINSSVGLEALLLGRHLHAWGDNPYCFILQADTDAEILRRLEFFLLGYLVPFSLLLNPDYLRFRLAQPGQEAIIQRHMTEYMHHDNLDPAVLDGLSPEQQISATVLFSNLERHHREQQLQSQRRQQELEQQLQLERTQKQQQADVYEKEVARLAGINRATSARLEQADSDLQHTAHALLQVRSSLSWRLTLPLRLAARLLRGDWASVRVSWQQARCEGGRRGQLVRYLDHQQLRLRLLMRPTFWLKAVRMLRAQGVAATWARAYQVLGRHSAHLSPASIPLGQVSEVVVLTTPHCRYLAELMAAALARVELGCDIIEQRPPQGFNDRLHIVICPQMFDELPSHYIAYQLEQSVSSRWFTPDYLSRLEHAMAVFDYSLRNISYLQTQGLSHRQLYYLPVGYLAGREPAAVTNDVDVLFYGDINNERRQAYITALQQHFTVKVVSNLFGAALYAEMAKAKVIVNIHYYEGALLETTRLYECLSQNRIVVSEEGCDMEEHAALRELVDFVPVNDVNAMVERVRAWVNDETLRTARHESLAQACAASPDWFGYYFLRMLLAFDLISYDQFYQAAGAVITFKHDRLCLGLPETVDRRADFERDNHYDIQYFPGLRHRLGWVGCGLSYKFLLQRARDLGLPRIVICEDDVAFPAEFMDRLAKIEAYLDQRHDWDLFSGLIAHLNPDTTILQAEQQDTDMYLTIDRMTSTVMNIYSSRFYGKLLGWDDQNHDAQSNTIDRYIESRDQLRVVTTPTFLVGHKEELDSTLWGFNNQTYVDMIAESERLLGEKLADFLKS